MGRKSKNDEQSRNVKPYDGGDQQFLDAWAQVVEQNRERYASNSRPTRRQYRKWCKNRGLAYKTATCGKTGGKVGAA